jgi:hypothetical protein
MGEPGRSVKPSMAGEGDWVADDLAGEHVGVGFGKNASTKFTAQR